VRLPTVPGGSPTGRLRALPNVVFLDRCDIVGLATTPDARRVIGARVLRRADGSAEEVLAADLVVDATGRGSRTPAWLDALGYPRPEQEQVRIGLGYATRTYRLPAAALDGDLAVLQAATPQHPRTEAIQALEGDLERGVEPQPHRWFRDLARVVDVPWDMAAGGDLVFPGVQGRRTTKVRLVSAYLTRLHAAAAHDAHLAIAFIRVAGLVAPPQSLLRPGIVLRVLRNGLGPSAGDPGRPQHQDTVRAAQTAATWPPGTKDGECGG
jgi:hypothetical protein